MPRIILQKFVTLSFFKCNIATLSVSTCVRLPSFLFFSAAAQGSFLLFTQRRGGGAPRRLRPGSAGCSLCRLACWPGVRQPRRLGACGSASWAARYGFDVRPHRLLRFLKGCRHGSGHADSSATQDTMKAVVASSFSAAAFSWQRPRAGGWAGAASSTSRRSLSALSPIAAASPGAGLPIASSTPFPPLLPSWSLAPDQVAAPCARLPESDGPGEGGATPEGQSRGVRDASRAPGCTGNGWRPESICDRTDAIISWADPMACNLTGDVDPLPGLCICAIS